MVLRFAVKHFLMWRKFSAGGRNFSMLCMIVALWGETGNRHVTSDAKMMRAIVKFQDAVKVEIIV